MLNKLFKKLTKKETGKLGEDIALKYLSKKGYKLLSRNFTCPFGEVDIVMEHDNVIIFIEVKTRSSDKYGYGYFAVDKSKQNKIINCSSFYCQKFSLNRLVRFDVVSIDISDKNIIKHITNAFTL